MSFSRALPFIAIVLLISLLMSSTSNAQRARRGAPAAGMVNLPFGANDAAGNQWLIYQGGWMQQRGNVPVFAQSAAIQLNGNPVNAGGNQARRDARTGEIVLENLNAGVAGITLTRRILVDERESYLRYIDILKNTTPQEQSVAFMVQTNLNYGVASAQFINEPNGKQRPLGWAAATPVGRGAVELFAGRGAKSIPQLNWQGNSNFIQAQLQLVIPANKEVAFMHIHATCATPEEGIAQMAKLTEARLLAGVSADLRREIVNFTGGGGFLGDREDLRGDVLDVVELRGGGANATGGDQLKGTINEPTLAINTFYGLISLPTDKVVGMINIGQFRPRQLIISSDGEVFGGRLAKETIELQLSSGQTTQVPLSQISRIGWRKRPGEPDEMAAPTTRPSKPQLALRSGDRIDIEMPQQPIDVVTRYGTLKLDPNAVASIDFASEETGVHRIGLTDGSQFSGLITADAFQFKLSGGAGGQTVSLPASSITRIVLSNREGVEPDDSAPTLALSNNDLLVGSLVGELKLDTAFDTIALSAPQIKAMSRSKEGGADVQIELWDDSRLSGQLQQSEINCALLSGVTLKVPVMMVEQYDQPAPQPSAAMLDRIRQLVTALSADEWKERERAQQQLSAIGIGVLGILKDMRDSVGPEAQQRIDAIVKDVEAKRAKAVPAQPAPPVEDGE